MNKIRITVACFVHGSGASLSGWDFLFSVLWDVFVFCTNV